MAGYLALLSAFVFTALALRRDVRLSDGVSVTVWIPTLWMMRCASRSMDLWFHAGAREANVYDQWYLPILLIAAVAVLARRGEAFRRTAGLNVPLLVLFAYLVLSVSWSPIPIDSTKRAVRACGDLVMAVLLATEVRPHAAIMAMCRRCAFVLIPLSLALAKYYPALGRAREKNWAADSWIGVATHKNTLGQLCLVAGLVLVVHIIQTARRRKLSWRAVPVEMRTEVLCLALSIYLLGGFGGSTYSTTSVIATALGLGVTLTVGKLRSRPRMVPAFLLVGCIGFMMAMAASELIVGKSLRVTVADLQGKDSTLAGRTELWREVWRRASDHPWLGSGYGGFWTTRLMAELESRPEFSWGPQQAHNGYLETYAQLGAIGLILLGWTIWHGISGSLRILPLDFDDGQLRVALLLPILLLNYSEAGFPRQNHLMWFMFLVSSVHSLAAMNRVSTHGPAAGFKRTAGLKPPRGIRTVTGGASQVGGIFRNDSAALARTGLRPRNGGLHQQNRGQTAK
jgi:exopolysaccharide production protein ExoQ